MNKRYLADAAAILKNVVGFSEEDSVSLGTPRVGDGVPGLGPSESILFSCFVRTVVLLQKHGMRALASRGTRALLVSAAKEHQADQKSKLLPAHYTSKPK